MTTYFVLPSRRFTAERFSPNEIMTNKFHHNDQPIAQPGEDRFGIDPFAKALASSIREMASPEGAVIALNGPWGSGKSSAVNLVLYHLRKTVAANEIVVINFACLVVQRRRGPGTRLLSRTLRRAGSHHWRKVQERIAETRFSPSPCWIIGRRSRRHGWSNGRGRCGFRSNGVAIWTYPTGRDS